MSSGCLIVIFSVNISVHINVKNRKQITAVLKIVKVTKNVCPHPLRPKNHGEKEKKRRKKKGESMEKIREK